MLTVKTTGPAFKIISKLDLEPIIQELRNIDIFSEEDISKREISTEQYGYLLFEIIAKITPQLGSIADDIPEFVAAYKNVSKRNY